MLLIRKPSRTVLLFLLPFLLLVLLFSVFIYYTVSSYSASYLFQLLEARANKVAKENFEGNREKPALSTVSAADKLPHEKDYFIPINNQLNLGAEARKVGVGTVFFEEVIEKGSSEYVSKQYLYKGIRYPSPSGNFIVITVAENYFEINKSATLIKTLLFVVGSALLLLLYIAIYYSKNIFKPISAITESVKDISSENLHLRLDHKSSNTELIELTQTFNDMLDRIETSFETQNNFISNASHEFRTPLTAIIGEADVTLSKPRSPEEYIDTLQIVLQEAEKLDNKTKALLFLAQTGFDGKIQKFEKVRIDELLWEVKQNLEGLNPANRIYIDTELLPENPMKLKVKGNLQLLHLAFSNIISNGCKYSNYQTVTVSIGASDDFVYVVVKDTGIGIPPGEIQYIYDPFFRASNTKNFEGFGIGLPLTRNIIRMHQGKILVTSVENEGVVVQITLPVWKDIQ